MTLTSQDIRFPTEAHMVVEKLYGWSVAMDIFHRLSTPLACNAQAAMLIIGPCLHQIMTQMADTPSIGMDLMCCIMFKLQQDYFAHLVELAKDCTVDPPTFKGIIKKVTTYRADSLCPLPVQWCALVDAPAPKGRTPCSAPLTP